MCSQFRKLKTAVFLQPLKHNARRFFFFFSLATHTAPAISITAMWSQREQYICQQDQVLNRHHEPHNPSRHPLCWPQQSPPKPLNLGFLAQFIEDILLFSARKTLPSPVRTTWGALGYRHKGVLQKMSWWMQNCLVCFVVSNAASLILIVVFKSVISQRRDMANKNSLAFVEKLVIVAQL